jgi:choline dehydrogenase-like flavoprotein
MTREVLIVGSGPAAAGAALAATQRPGVHVAVIDVGTRLEDGNQQARLRMGLLPPERWEARDLAMISRSPAGSDVGGLPEKRSFGSDFPFRDAGQRGELTASGRVNKALVSGAYGGFSNVWGAQIMPFSAATFQDWPIGAGEMYRHYATILRHVPHAAEQDDLAELFPILGNVTPLPPLSERSSLVLARYARHRKRLARRGIVLGRARLAFKAADCVRCGLCMTGCPYLLIYSASQTMDELRAAGRITYHGELLAVAVEQAHDRAVVFAREIRTGRCQRFTADRVFLACGAVGTARLAMGSLRLFDTLAVVQESRQFVLPFFSRATRADPRYGADFTLNQFNMVIKLDSVGHDLSQLHFYTYNSAFSDALPGFLKRNWAHSIRGQLLRRVSVAIGYLPSWASPTFTMQVHPPRAPWELPPLSLAHECHRFVQNRMLRTVLARVAGTARWLDLWPGLAMLTVSATGKSYHWGGVFPHTHKPAGRFSSDRFGRIAPWSRVHLVDGSVFPSVPATTFTLTVMANAHRIADSALSELE